MPRDSRPGLHSHPNLYHLLFPDLFDVSLQHKPVARPMASTFLMLKRRAELGSEARHKTLSDSTSKLRGSRI